MIEKKGVVAVVGKVRLSTLVILGASVTGLAVARHARDRGLQPVVVDSKAGPALYSRRATPVKVEGSDAGAILDRLSDLGGGDAALIATSDAWLRFVIDHRAVLAAAFESILHPDNATLDICLDKLAFARWCEQHALPCPATWSATLAARPQAVAFPLLIRPMRTAHNRTDLPKAVQVNNEAELHRWLTQLEAKGVAAIVSESLLGRSLEQFSVPFARRAGKTLLFTARKVRPSADLCQTGTYVRLCPDENVAALAQSAVDRLDYFGIGEVEILRDTSSGQQFLIEINARPWLQYALAPSSNHDFLGFVLDIEPLSPGEALRAGKTWIDLSQDLFVAFSRSIGAVRHGRLGLFEYLRSLLRCNVFALFDWRDPGPFFWSLRSPR